MSLADLFAGRDVDLESMYTRMKGLMDAEDLPYGQRTHTYNSRLAQELGKYADTTDHGDAYHDAMYRAYFVDAKNIGEPEILEQIAVDVGLPRNDVVDVLNARSFKDAVDQDWAKSRQYGVTGVPTFVANMRGVVGAQPYEMLEQLVTEAGAKTRLL